MHNSSPWVYPSVRMRVDQVGVSPGEVITIWLGDITTDPEKRRTQVELRVLPDGTREIFVQGPAKVHDSFDRWHPLGQPTEGENGHE